MYRIYFASAPAVFDAAVVLDALALSLYFGLSVLEFGCLVPVWIIL